MEDAKCEIWGDAAKRFWDGDLDVIVSARAGGEYVITGTALAELLSTPDSVRRKLTTWLVDQRRLGNNRPVVTSEVVADVKVRKLLSASARAVRLLEFFESKSESVGELVYVSLHGDVDDSLDTALATTESIDIDEVWYLHEYLESGGLIETNNSTGFIAAKVTVDGFEELARLATQQTNSEQCFVAMWFDESVQAAYDEGVCRGVEDAGYVPLRIDGKHHNNKIDDEIIAEIRRSRFVVVDFTQAKDNARGGVYYEAGFAHGLDIPVIFTCRADAIKYVHFDTRQYNHIVWKTPEELRQMLAQRISAVIGDGPHRVSN